MELKDAGLILRSLAESWCEKQEASNNEAWSMGYDAGRGRCGITLNDLLDKCGIPELEEEPE